MREFGEIYLIKENDMGVIKVDRIGIRQAVEEGCRDLIRDDKLAELVYIYIMLPLEDYLDDCEEDES